jgi:adenosine deaminase
VELHLHLEGSLPASVLARLSGARRRKQDAAHLAALYRFQGFRGFLRSYARVCSMFRAPEDLRLAVMEVGRRLRRDAVVHAEIYFSPSVHARNGLSYRAVVDSLEAGAEHVEAGGGPSLLFIADGVRQWGAGEFGRMVREMARNPSSRVVGVGLGGDELAVPIRRFAAAFRRARDLGLAGLVHAGEVGPASSVRDAIRWLRPRRIAHGIRALEDPEVVRTLKGRGITLDICLTSNRRTGAVPPGERHPLPEMMARGLPVTLGTDDPALFHVTLTGEYGRAAALGLRGEDLAKLAVQGARSSLLGRTRREALIRDLGRAWGL